MKAFVFVLLVVLLGCTNEVEVPFYEVGEVTPSEQLSEGNGYHEDQEVFIEAAVLRDLADDGRAFVVIEINDEQIEARNEQEFKVLLLEKQQEILQQLEQHEIKVVSVFHDGYAFTAEITEETLGLLKKSPYVEAVRTVKVIAPRL